MSNLDKILPYGTLIIALAGLVARIILPNSTNSRREAIFTLALALLLSMAAIGVYKAIKYDEIVKKVSEHIIEILSDDTKTFDEIFIELTPFRVNFSIANETLEYMVDTNKVGYKILSVRDGLNREFLVIGFCVKKPSSCG